MKITLALAGAVLAASLTACSGGSGGADGASGSYCDQLKSAKTTFDTLSAGDLSQLEKGFATFHRLADAAPDDLKDQWKVLDDAASSVEDALKDAGLSFDDLPKIQAGQVPEGVDLTKMTSFAADLQKLNSKKFTDARADIAKQAKDTCKVDLGTS